MFRLTLQKLLNIEHFCPSIFSKIKTKEMGHSFDIIEKCSMKRTLWRKFYNFKI